MNLMILRILWGAMFISTGIYMIIPDLISRPEALSQYLMLIIFAGLAVMVGVTSFILPPRLFRKGLEERQFEVVDVQDPQEERGYRNTPSTQRRFADPSEVRKRLLATWLSPFLVSLAMAEAIAIFGLILLFLGARWIEGIPFFLASWALFAVRFPREAKLIATVEELYQAKLDDA